MIAADSYIKPEYELNHVQFDFVTTEHRETYFRGGYGSGKSFALGIAAYAVAQIPGTVSLIVAPTLDVLRNATMRQVINECWIDKLGLIEGVHFVINEQAPDEWNVARYSILSSKRIVTWRNGSYTVLDALENYTKHVGAQYDEIFVDEWQNVDPQSRKFLLGRLRGVRYKQLGIKHKIRYAMTPPDSPIQFKYLKDLQTEFADNPDFLFLTGSSYLNKENLPDGYIEGFIRGMDDMSVRQFIYGELVENLAGRFAYGFREAIHVSEEAELDPELPIHLWFDFNIGIMPTLVAQLSKDFLYVIDEFKPEKDIDIDVRCDRITESRYADQLWSCTITGDPARGQTGIKANVDYYTRIMSNLRLKDYQFKVRKKHPFVKDSRQLINTMFNRFPKLKVHPRCVNLIKDLKYCAITEDGDLDKDTDKTLTHYLDAFRYGVDMNFIWFLAKKLETAA